MHITLEVAGLSQYFGRSEEARAESFFLNWTAQYDTDDVEYTKSPYTEAVQWGKAKSSVIETNLPVGDFTDGEQTPRFGHYDYKGPYLFIGGPVFGNPTDQSMGIQVRPLDGVLPLNILSTPRTLTFSDADNLTGEVISWNPDGSGAGYIFLYPSSITITVSAVPEPATYGMLFAGLALVGVVAARRKRA